MAKEDSPRGAKRQKVDGAFPSSGIIIIVAATCLLFAIPASGSSAQISLALDSKCILGESPVWDAKLKRLHFVDINGKKLHSYDPASEKCSTVQFDEEVGCVVPYQKKRVLVAGVSNIWQVDFEVEGSKTGELGDGTLLPTFVATIPDSECEQVENQGQEEDMVQPIPGFRFNDGKCDPKGRFLVGNMNKDWRDPEARKGKLFKMVEPPELRHEDDLDGMLHQYGPNAVLKVCIDQVTLSNGMCWGKSEGKGEGDPFDIFYFIDSALQTVDRFDYDEATGDIDLASRKTVVKVPSLADGGGVPDGMTIDHGGMLWVALGEAGCVVQYDPKTGDEIMRVKLPVQRPTACTFGGDGLEDLYVTTREEKGDKASENWGGLFKVKVPGVKGLDPAYHYGHRE